MPEKSEQKLDLKGRLNKQYRFIIQNEETLLEIESIRLKIWHVLSIFIGSSLTIGLLSFLLFFYTPLNKIIGKWSGIQNNTVYADLNKRIIDLEELVEDHEVYKKGIENMLNGISIPDSENEETDMISKTDAQQKVEHLFFVKPVNGVLSAQYDIEKNHIGIDITAPENTPIKSVLPGTVIEAAWNPETGNAITIQHSNDLISVYKHNSALLKAIGDEVKAGESIAIIGNTGELSSGPHLHFELWHKGQSLNPEHYINL